MVNVLEHIVLREFFRTAALGNQRTILLAGHHRLSSADYRIFLTFNNLS